jgi:threonine dehydrogenase-like Zn-dependent dehydrogenase
MKQVKAFGPGDLRVIEADLPVLEDSEVLVDVHACGICGSDKWFWLVDSPNDYVAGHEVAGQVVAIGAGVKNLQVGDRVSVNNVNGCGKCPALKGNLSAVPLRLHTWDLAFLKK